MSEGALLDDKDRNHTAMEHTDVLIIGAGFAGAATAYHLSRQFKGSLLLVDKETTPGGHASGRNAALVYQPSEHLEVRRATVASRAFFSAKQKEVGFRMCGSVLLGRRDQIEDAQAGDTSLSEIQNPDEIRRRVQALAGHPAEAVLWTATDGVLDVAALLQLYLSEARERGVCTSLSCEVLDIRKTDRFQVETSLGTITAHSIINAAGAWAPHLARVAGAAELPLTPLKRHLFTLGGVRGLDRRWPFVWSLEHDFYFRPEIDSLLFSICDEERCDHLEETVNPEISQALAAVILRHLPALQEAVQERVWSCFRTKSSDGRFVIGWDPQVENYFWVAGLGGNGAGASWEIGRVAAELFLRRDRSSANPFDPARFS